MQKQYKARQSVGRFHLGDIVGGLLGLDPITAIGLLVAIAGLLVSFMSFLINWYYKRQENKRAEQLHQIALSKAKGECNVE